MAYRIQAIPMTSRDLQGHSQLQAFTNVISHTAEWQLTRPTDIAYRVVPPRLQSFLLHSCTIILSFLTRKKTNTFSSNWL